MNRHLCAPHDAQQRVWWLVFDDRDHQPMVFAGNGAEAAARKAFDFKSRHWNCHLLATVPYHRPEVPW